ncbi:VOC family protein [Streptomyces sp. NPDC058773]|uniref:VOC family protein n=1 Tax=Streptomyces sp. NPDC058773 TaxID=3346632 RepID=UPI003681F6BF
MHFVSIRVITEDVERLARFYEQVTGVSAVRPAPVFAELALPSCALAIQAKATLEFGAAADNHSVIIEFRVEDVDTEYERLKPLVSEWIQEPTTMPWGNRSILFRDPDGNIVNLFTPVSEEAIARFSGR